MGVKHGNWTYASKEWRRADWHLLTHDNILHNNKGMEGNAPVFVQKEQFIK
jgi:hypothetical protein